jgi:hypothetical protein
MKPTFRTGNGGAQLLTKALESGDQTALSRKGICAAVALTLQ